MCAAPLRRPDHRAQPTCRRRPKPVNADSSTLVGSSKKSSTEDKRLTTGQSGPLL